MPLIILPVPLTIPSDISTVSSIIKFVSLATESIKLSVPVFKPSLTFLPVSKILSDPDLKVFFTFLPLRKALHSGTIFSTTLLFSNSNPPLYYRRNGWPR